MLVCLCLSCLFLIVCCFDFLVGLVLLILLIYEFGCACLFELVVCFCLLVDSLLVVWSAIVVFDLIVLVGFGSVFGLVVWVVGFGFDCLLCLCWYLDLFCCLIV